MTDDGQRIVGIRIPTDQVGPIIRALGTVRDLREPEEIFNAVLHESEGVALASGLTLCRKLVHHEAVIELLGVEPNRFAEIRTLGLINEQIAWKQRFFVPTEQELGISVLTTLLSRYPVIVNEPAEDKGTAAAEVQALGLNPAQVIDLRSWIVAAESSEVPSTAIFAPHAQQPAFLTNANQMTLWDAIPVAA
jgi:hypothetical protein